MSPRATSNTFTSATAILRILEEIQRPRVMTVRSAAKLVGTSEAQAREYLSFLAERGSISVTKRGRTNEYHLPTAARRANSLARTVGTKIALEASTALKGTFYYDQATDRLADDLQSEPDDDPAYSRASNSFRLVPSSTPMDEAKHAAAAETILDALCDGRRLRGKYARLGDGRTKTYWLRPITLYLHADALRLLARKRNGQVRSFDVDGFSSLAATRKHRKFDPVEAPDSEFSFAFGRYLGFPPKASTIRVHGTAARQLGRRKFHHSQENGEYRDGHLDVRFNVGLCPDFVGWLISMVPEMEAIAPPELREMVVERLVRGLQAHEELATSDDGQ